MRHKFKKEVTTIFPEQLYGLIANPATHSFSPIIQNAAFKQLNIAAHYFAFTVDSFDFDAAIKGIKALGTAGFNISSPYKAEIIKYLDQIDPAAARLNSVNTVKVSGKHLQGFSTDGPGFWQSLQGFKKSQVLLLGTGGAARAIMACAQNYGVKNLAVFNRSSNLWAQKVATTNQLAKVPLYDLADRNSLHSFLKQVDLVINATTLGMNENDPALLTNKQIALTKPTTVFVDLIYARPTAFLKKAAKLNRKTVNGIPMLLEQAALSFKIWTGIAANSKAMIQALQQVINPKNWAQSGIDKV